MNVGDFYWNRSPKGYISFYKVVETEEGTFMRYYSAIQAPGTYDIPEQVVPAKVSYGALYDVGGPFPFGEVRKWDGYPVKGRRYVF